MEKSNKKIVKTSQNSEEDILMKKIAENLKMLRVERNYSQGQIGDWLEMNDYTAYQRLEHGKAKLKFSVAIKLAKLYNIPMEWIFDLELRNHESNQSFDSSITLGNKTAVQITVVIDGTDETLVKQIDLLKSFNKVILMR